MAGSMKRILLIIEPGLLKELLFKQKMPWIDWNNATK